jgi:hypothetical protein
LTGKLLVVANVEALASQLVRLAVQLVTRAVKELQENRIPKKQRSKKNPNKISKEQNFTLLLNLLFK